MIGALAAPVVTVTVHAIKSIFGGSKDAKEREHQEKTLKDLLHRLDNHKGPDHQEHHEKKHWGEKNHGWER